MLSTILLAATIIGFGIYVYKFPPRSRTSSGNSICMDYSKDQMSTLGINLVRTMTDGYERNQLQDITIPNDAESVWFDLETLKKFIYHTEFNTKNNDRNITSKDLGLRIYYASYPELGIWSSFSDLNVLANNPDTQGYSHLHTIVAIPTLRKGKLDYDFNPLDMDTYQPDQENMNVIYPINSAARVSAIGVRNAGSRIGAQNHGSLIPPAPPAAQAF